MPLRHVVLLSFVDGTSPAQRDAVVDALRGLPPVIGEIRSYTVGADAGVSEGNHDVVVIAEFDDADALRAYQAHPAHQAVLDDLVKPILRKRAAIQFLV